ncbi:hypothetical protein M011DRAFT_413431 [Sporormia fimetaria CBS 119925]|uniref:Uncharacterized protein n=1 Tax=Sporormia fimetaria CBS 119925 TaxID=1340428 RepID=A0A6A6UW69_9PLEO|nr:hypothetical protein M011DRAFT_413431 [Sporormia fimetaria CBS 119925]
MPSFLRPGSYKSSPVFNRPLDTERSYCLSRAFHLVLLTLLTLLSMSVVGLKALTLAFIEDNTDRGFSFLIPNGTSTTTTTLAALPRQLHTAPAKLALVAGVVATIVGLTHTAFIIWDWRTGKRTQSYVFRRNAMFLHFCNSIMILFSLVSIFGTHRSTSHFKEKHVMQQAYRFASPSSRFFRNNDDEIRYNIGTFDLETWSCELKSVEGARSVWSEYEKQCGVEMAGRVMVIPFMITAFLIVGACVVEMMRCRRDADGRRMKTEEVGVELGKLENRTGVYNAL